MNHSAIADRCRLTLLAISTAVGGGVAAQPSDDITTEEQVVIALTEPLPGSAALADPVIAADWPLARRARAAKILYGAKPVDMEGLRAYLRARVAWRDATMQAVRLEIARNRRWADVCAVVRLCGHPDISLRTLSIAVAGAAAPRDSVELYLSDTLPGREALADPAVAADWTAERRERAGKTFHDGQPVTAAELRSLLRTATADPQEPQRRDRHRAVLLRLEVADTRSWDDLLAIVELCGDPEIDIRHIEITPVTWGQKAGAQILPSGPRIKLTDDGRFGVEWEWADGSLKILEVGDGGCLDAGIQVGDRFVAVDGKQLASDTEMREIRDEVASGERPYAVLDVKRAGRRLRFVLTR